MPLTVPTGRITALLALSLAFGLALDAQQSGKASKAPAPAGDQQATKTGQPAKTAKTPAAPRASQQAPSPASSRRDPFEALVARVRAGSAPPMPECRGVGKAGLVIRTLGVQGTIRSQGGMIAVVTNQLQRVHFLREADQLCDGRVERITLEAITFREVSKDEYGKPIDRLVVKRLYPSAGEQQ